MAITSALKAAARTAYRNLLRAGATTFSGDEPMFQAFREKVRKDALQAREEVDPTRYAEKTALAVQIANVLRKNIVQAEKIPGQEVWRLRMTGETELGSNETIKTSTSTKLGQSPGQSCHSNDTGSLASPNLRYYSALKRAHKQRLVPVLKEQDLEESFVRGGGPGGQAINKTMNNVQLLHKPTNIRVTCQESRSLELNRRLARRLLLEKLDELHNPGLSKGDLARARQRERERRRRRKAKRKHQKSNQ